jgi:hypothetical protein
VQPVGRDTTTRHDEFVTNCERRRPPVATDPRLNRLDKLERLTGAARASLADHAGLLKPRAASLAAVAEEFELSVQGAALAAALTVPAIPPERPAAAG